MEICVCVSQLISRQAMAQRTNVDMPAAGESAVHGASEVCDELAVLGAGRRENDGSEGKVGSVGDFLS